MVVPTRPSPTVLTGALLSGLVLGTSVVLKPSALPGLEICPLWVLARVPCPGCGMTRAFCAIGHGEVVRAWWLNPWSLPLYAATLLALVLPLLVRIMPGVTQRVLSSRALVWSPLVLALLMWVWDIVRVLGHWPWPQ